MTVVIHAKPADSPGYTRITLDEPVGDKQASALVTAQAGESTQEIHACGQRDLDVLDGAEVTFPDGTVWKPSASAKK